METKTSTKKRRISVTLPDVYLEALDRLVEEGICLSYGAAIREALRHLFRLYGIEPFTTPASAEAPA